MQVSFHNSSLANFIPEPIWSKAKIIENVRRLSKEILPYEKQLSPSDLWDDIQAILSKKENILLKQGVYLQPFLISLDPSFKEKEKEISLFIKHAVLVQSLLDDKLPLFVSAQILLHCSEEIVKRAVEFSLFKGNFPLNFFLTLAENSCSYEQRERLFSLLFSLFESNMESILLKLKESYTEKQILFCLASSSIFSKEWRKFEKMRKEDRQKQTIQRMLALWSSPTTDTLYMSEQLKGSLEVTCFEDLKMIVDQIPSSKKIFFLYCYPNFFYTYRNDLENKEWWNSLFQVVLETILKKKLYSKDLLNIQVIFLVMMINRRGKECFSHCCSFLSPANAFIIIAELRCFLKERMKNKDGGIENVRFFKDVLKANLQNDKFEMISSLLCDYWKAPTLKMETAIAFSKDLLSEHYIPSKELPDFVKVLHQNPNFSFSFYNFSQDLKLKVVKVIFELNPTEATKIILSMIKQILSNTELEEKKKDFIQELLMILDQIDEKEKFLESLSQEDRNMIDSI